MIVMKLNLLLWKSPRVHFVVINIGRQQSLFVQFSYKMFYYMHSKTDFQVFILPL